MTTRIGDRGGFDFGVRPVGEALNIISAHPWAIFELITEHQCMMTDQLSALSYIEELEDHVRVVLY